MKPLNCSLYILCSASVALAACSGSASRSALLPQGRTASIADALASPYNAVARLQALPPQKGDSRISWMAPEAATEDLLYVSNLQNVAVYSYPKGRRVGTLKGFFSPNGECVDSVGDVFIANQDTVVEYKHGGKKRIQTLSFSGYTAVDCASDPTTGNLAVTWNKSASSENYVAIYMRATGSPTLYGLNGDFVFYCGYDNRGNLFVDGQVGSQSQEAIFLELRHGTGKLQSLTLNQSFEHVGAIQWDGKYVAIGDDEAEKIYRFAISGSSGTLQGTVSLNGLTISYQWWISGRRVIVPNSAFVNYQPLGQVLYYKYPQGGSASKTISDGDGTAPYGVTLSRAPQ